MGMFEKLQLSDTTVANIEWEITPDLVFCTFSAQGLRGGLAKTGERVCYFFIDVILHAFDWRYTDIAAPAEKIAGLGYAGRALSPKAPVCLNA